jgi:hypothetical protein
MFGVIADSQGEVWDKTRTMIGGVNALALLLVTSALNETTENPDFKETAKLMDMSEGGLTKESRQYRFLKTGTSSKAMPYGRSWRAVTQFRQAATSLLSDSRALVISSSSTFHQGDVTQLHKRSCYKD